MEQVNICGPLIVSLGYLWYDIYVRICIAVATLVGLARVFQIASCYFKGALPAILATVLKAKWHIYVDGGPPKMVQIG